MATEKWVIDTNWTAAFGTEVNSLATGNAIISSVNISNSTSLDMFMDISVSLGSFTPAAPNFVGFYLYPLNQDGTSYGDGRFAAAAAGPPPSTYFKGTIILIAAAQVQTGIVTGILLPPGDFKLVLFSRAGATLAASANTIKYRTYNRSVL